MMWPNILRKSLTSAVSILRRAQQTNSAPLPGAFPIGYAVGKMTIHTWFAIFTIWLFLKMQRFSISISVLTASDKFQRMLAVLQSDNEYAQEYERFVSGVSYAAPEQTPGFTEAVDSLRNLVKALHLETKI